ncbi:MAG: MBL fold metallo-hydrolase [Planctomycetes bacterium]|jgi:glyoxylase-like metal-dependent hydrolase (beta-lactamase superfamily II)|nr:MBL fold metallo-hydrolase [Planctomycetota bacterium]MBT4028003.1 MBL fold metallo-hydrolase [Planctomycetota bacterium]MBT4561107.1 MBL fold metallo-hydrolase [Planctomycetota bacterium]MBT5120994.1 MBL fold metallo-hydrolase [Planctomycetota bacterium]MBT7012194.1 MBL fold metallo-hydrolase [Planctomycetota bacterium]
MATRETQIGRWRIRALNDARFALDGGAMFGVVPRVMWESLTEVHDDHTIPMATTPFLLEDDAGHVILIEPGMGRRWGDRQKSMFHIDHSGGHDLLESLAAAGVAPSAVTHCLMSHCHFDHIGAACDESGEPVFPNAQHWAAKVEIDAGIESGHLRRASYRREDIEPIEKAGLLHTYDKEVEIAPGVSMVALGGHSEGVSVILIRDAGETACFWSDVVPTRHHVHLPFLMAYDLNAEASFAVRKKWIPRAAAQGWVALLYHDPDEVMGRFVELKPGRFGWKAL